MEALRIITAGSIDDGKSTLIGRLLYDTNTLMKDQVRHLEVKSKNKGLSYTDFSLLTDGLKEEMQRNITIDVAYRYFSTAKRKYILADTPGHIEYISNFVTAASLADVAVLLIDSRNGIAAQTKRHAYIASLMGVGTIIFCINKMDLVHYSQDVFESISQEALKYVSKFHRGDVKFIPVSALHGDNIVTASSHMSWNNSMTLINELEEVQIRSWEGNSYTRFPVQTVIKEKNTDQCFYAGRVSGGDITVDDEVTILPGGYSSRVAEIFLGEAAITKALNGMSVAISLKEQHKIERGNVICGISKQPIVSDHLTVNVYWLSEKKLSPGQKITIKTVNQESFATVIEIIYKIDIHSIVEQKSVILEKNDIGKIVLVADDDLVFDRYENSRTLGSILCIDTECNEVIAAGIIE